MKLREVLKWAPVIHAVSVKLEQAEADGVVTYGEAVNIAASAAHEVLIASGLEHKPLLKPDEK